MDRKQRSIVVAAVLAVLGVLSALPAASADPLTGVVAQDGIHSGESWRLGDGVVGASDDVSWKNADGRWDVSSYPMVAILDLGALHELSSISYFAGQIPFPNTAEVRFAASQDGAAGTFETVAVGASPSYNKWSNSLSVSGQARFVEVRFESRDAHFNLAEIAVEATLAGNPDPDPVPVPDPDPGQWISGTIVVDGANSQSANRLIDRTIGTAASLSWQNPQPWNPDRYPMTAIIDLGTNHDLSKISYFVGNLHQGSNEVIFEGSTTASGNSFTPLGINTDNHSWGEWADLNLSGENARRVRVRFNSPNDRFNISEVRVFGIPANNNGDPDNPDNPDNPDDPDIPGGPVADAHLATTTVDSFGEANRPEVDLGPGWNAVDSYYTNFPRRSGECSKEIHNSYWVLGQDNKIHPTWHPIVHPSGCAFAHDHGDQPTLSPIYDTSSGVPFAMTTGFDNGGHRHEDHVGHKVIVQSNWELVSGSTFTGTPAEVTPTGYKCDWLSKIHQGSSTNDALKHNGHEYLLNIDCTDGVEVHLSTILTFGPPEIVTNICGGGTGSEQFDTGLTATMGIPVAQALDGKREFHCITGPGGMYGSMQYKPATRAWFEELWKADGVIDLPGNGQQINFSPYYGIQNPARYIDNEWTNRGLPNAYLSTLDLCYDDNPSYRVGLEKPSFCQFAPSTLEGLSSSARQRHTDNPMNGTIRVTHPKDFAIRSENVPGGEAGFVRFCTDALGHDAAVLGAGESCPTGRVEQFVSRQDRWYMGWAGSDVNSQWINGKLFGSGMFNEWTRDFNHPSIRFPN